VGKLRYGIIGTGWIAERKHLAAYSAREDVELAAVCNPNVVKAEQVAKRYDIPNVYEHYDAMLRQGKLDILSICTPNASHFPIVKAAMAEGIHVHCEKPLVLNAQELDELLRWNEKYPVSVFVGMDKRYSSPVRFLKSAIDSGEMGSIYHVKASWLRRRGIPGLGGWFTNKRLSGGGALIDLGVHLVDLALYLMDFPTIDKVSGSTYAHFSTLSHESNRGAWAANPQLEARNDVEDMGAGYVTFAGHQRSLYFEASWASNVKQESMVLEVFGTKAGARLADGRLELYSEIGHVPVNIEPDLAESDPYAKEVELFIQSVRSGTKPHSNMEQAKDVMRIIDEIYAQSGNTTNNDRS
jgi:Predicted dehydrogenases and related proteins